MLEILCGNIASGKSTYAKKRAEQGAIIINDDVLVMAVHGGNYKLYSFSFKTSYKSLEMHIAMEALSKNLDVVIDTPCMRVDSRRRWIGLASAFDVYCVVRVFPRCSPEEHARRRAESDSRGYSYEYWLSVATRKDREYQQPTLSEGMARIEEHASA